MRLTAIGRDPSDNRLLEAALEGEADYIVSGDRDLLDLGSYEGIGIITPARFLAILREASERTR
jgi:predicted nucleic acid-binding protein